MLVSTKILHQVWLAAWRSGRRFCWPNPTRNRALYVALENMLLEVASAGVLGRRERQSRKDEKEGEKLQSSRCCQKRHHCLVNMGRTHNCGSTFSVSLIRTLSVFLIWCIGLQSLVERYKIANPQLWLICWEWTNAGAYEPVEFRSFWRFLKRPKH